MMHVVAISAVISAVLEGARRGRHRHQDHRAAAARRENPIASIAAALKLSRSTVRARIERLEQAGEIIGYTVILKAETIEMPVRGITMIEVEGRATAKVIDSLSGFRRSPRSTPPTGNGT